MNKLSLLFFLISGYAFSQTVTDYQYVIVPSKFTIFKEQDKFRLNTNVKLLLQKYGFKTFLLTDSIPSGIAGTKCKMLYADLKKNNDFFTTRVKIILKDCNEKIIYETAFGSSVEKDLAIAYNKALREAGSSFDKLHYKYNEENDSAKPQNSISEIVENRVQSLDITPATLPLINSAEIFYFAQPTANGYQVVDSQPKVILRLFNTSQKNVFMAVKGDVNGTLISKNGQWFFEYYKNGSLISEALNIKF